MDSYWQLIEKGMFSEAFNRATEEYEEHNDIRYLRQRASASIMMNNYENALADYLKVLDETEDRYKSDIDYIYVGVMYWLLGEYAKAIRMFIDSMTLKLPCTANIISPPAIVYFASVYLNNENTKKESIKYLKKLSKKKLPLALFLLNEINEAQLLNTIKEDSPIKGRMICKYELYIAVKYLENGDKLKFYEHLQKCIDTKKIIEFEYFISLAELNKRLK